MAKIVISYRRTDSDVTGRIFDRLVQRYGKDSVFRDIDDIPFGIDFRKVVNDALHGTDVLIAIVGPNWRGTHKRGSARINDDNDPVRIEVETALQSDIPVIPALVGGAMMPKPTELPDSLRDFSFRNAANIDSGRNFDNDIERLMRSMDRLLEGKTVETGPAETRGDTERIAVPTVRFQEPVEEAAATPAAIASLDQSIESERVAERVKAPSRRMALIGVLLGVVVIGAVGIWALFRPPTSIQPPVGDVHTPVRETVGDVPLSPERERALKPKDAFKECATCPEMVVMPAGSFTMGSPESEPERSPAENPQLKVTIAHPFAVGKFAVTRGEFEAFVKATRHPLGDACNKWSGTEWKSVQGKSYRDPGYSQDDKHPVVCVNWYDAEAYVAWLSKTVGKEYRLLSEAQREYVTRAGTTTPFWWGSSITSAQANYAGTQVYSGGGSIGEYRQRTVPVNSFEPNPWGLYNVHGNVWDWTEDCWNNSNNSGNPGDGTARTQLGGCVSRVVRGGSWVSYPQTLRSANRPGNAAADRDDNLGFRVGRTLTP